MSGMIRYGLSQLWPGLASLLLVNFLGLAGLIYLQESPKLKTVISKQWSKAIALVFFGGLTSFVNPLLEMALVSLRQDYLSLNLPF